ncbi:MAG: hypothetical protein COC02_02205 [Rhodospirillaceae bacterium]|nr:MAG: hypothetical protein COC02_02205 [Rhodospirillaceae bacterium]
MGDRLRQGVVTVFGVALCLFTVLEMNYPRLQHQSALALFIMMGLVICFLVNPFHEKLAGWKSLRIVDAILALGVVLSCGYVVFQMEPMFQDWWAGGESLGDRAGSETRTDVIIGAKTFKLFTNLGHAFAVDQKTDKAFVDAMIRGARLVVKGTSSRGTKTTDTYSLKGFSAAFKAIGKACKVK